MKIDPVYLLAPLPTPPSMPTRRAFLLASSTFLAGTAVGGACGYSLGAAAEPAAGTPGPGPAAEPELTPSGDIELDELRRLAVKAPLDELFEKAPIFLELRVTTYGSDQILWRGVDRITKEIIENPSRRVDQAMIGYIINQIEGVARPEQPSLRDRVQALRARRAQESKRK